MHAFQVLLPYVAFLAVLMSSSEPKFLLFFVENTLVVVLHQVALKSDTMVRSYAHISEQLLQNKI